jgi:hypothetical protein
MHEALKNLAAKIEAAHDPKVAPDCLLPVDKILADMVTRKNAPRIVYVARPHPGQLWTGSTTTFVYAGIEQAFTTAGMMPGGNSAGYVKELKSLLARICSKTLFQKSVSIQKKNPSRRCV